MPEDGSLFGEIARRKGLASRAQIEEALRAQEGEFAGKPLGEILVARGYLTRREVESLLVEQHLSAEWEETFGRLVVEAGVVTEPDLHRTLKEHGRLREAGRRVFLGELLIAMGLASEADIRKVLDLQRERVPFVILPEEPEAPAS